MDISSKAGGTTAFASRRMAMRSRADFALSVVKYVYDVPLRPARYWKTVISFRGYTERILWTHSCTSDTMDVVLAVIGEIVVLRSG